MARRRTRTLHKADKSKTAAPQQEAVFTPEQAVAIAQALSGKAPANSQVAALPRNPAINGIPFGPGIPLVPSAINAPRPDSGRPEPRAYEYPITANLPGSNEKLVPWRILRDAADGVSIFRKCIEIRKNEFSSLDWDIVVSKKAIMRELRATAGGSRAELEQAMQARLAPEIARLSAFWEEPDQRNGLSWIEWIKKALEERFVLDALAIYPRHTLGGDMYGLEILDGSTIKPLLDELGGRPMPPSPAYQQILWGFPRGEFIADLGEDGLPAGTYPSDQLIYEVDNVRSWTPYGYGAVERALVDGALYMQRNQWQLAEYTDGVMPSGWLIAGEGQAEWSADELRAYESALNDYYSGITGNRQRLRILPYGMTPHESANQAEKYKPDYDLYLLKLCSGHFETTITELGFTETGGLGSTGYHEGQADVLDRKATRPTVAYVQALINKLSRRHLRMPPELEIQFAGQESEDEDVADQMADRQIKSGRLTVNEDRDRRGLARFTFPEADKPFIMGGTGGISFLEGSEERALQQAAQAQMLADAKANPAAPGEDDEGGQRGGHGDGPQKPKPGDGQGKPLDKVEDPGGDADLVKAELDAYTRWARKNPDPKRPFHFRYATPDHLDNPDPARVEFDGWVFIADGVVLDKVDVAAWNAAHPTHPRGPNGKFVKVGSELHELALRMAREMEHHEVGKAGHANVERWDAPAPPKAKAKRPTAADNKAQLERGRRVTAVADAASEIEELIDNGADPDTIRRRAAATARRHKDNADLEALAAGLEAADDADEMRQVAREFAEGHGLSRVGDAGANLPFDPSLHEVIPGTKQPRKGQQVGVVRPGYTMEDDSPLTQSIYGGTTVPVRRAVVAEPHAEVDTVDLKAVGERQRARREIIDEETLEAREAGALDEDFVPPTFREPTPEEIDARVAAVRRREARPLEGDLETPEEQNLRETSERLRGRGRRRATLEEMGLTPEQRAANPAPMEDIEGEVVEDVATPETSTLPDTEGSAADRELLPAPRPPKKQQNPEFQVGMAVEATTTSTGSLSRGVVVSRTGSSMKVKWGNGREENIPFRDKNHGVRLASEAEGDLPLRETTIPVGRGRRANLADAGRTTPAASNVVEGSIAEPRKSLKPDFSVDVEGVRAQLLDAPSREEAAAVIDRLGLKAPELKQLAKDLNITVRSSDSKAKVRDTIVALTAGRRLDSLAINPGNSRPARTAAPTGVSVEQAQRELDDARRAFEAGRGRRKVRMTQADGQRARVVREKEAQLEQARKRTPAPVHRPTAPAPVEHAPGAEVPPTPAQRRAAARAERLAARSKPASTAPPLEGEKALAAPPLDLAAMTKAGDPRVASLWYRTGDNSTDTPSGRPGFVDLNEHLRNPGPYADPVMDSRIADIDAAMAESKLTSPIHVVRGAYPTAIGLMGELEGVEFTDRAFVSTTTDESHAQAFGHIMRITVPAGVSAIRMADRDPSLPESEILLDRNLKYKVTAERITYKPNGRIESHEIDVEVVP